MRVLLDTHIWIWGLLDPERLSARVAGILADPDAEIWLSPVSVWELLVLAEKGRVELDDAPDAWVEQAMRRVPLLEAPVTHQIAVDSRRLELPHEDPADRFIAATARVHDLTLVTADDRLLGSDGQYAVLSNR